MQIFIAALVFVLILGLLLPWSQLFPRNYLKKMKIRIQPDVREFQNLSDSIHEGPLLITRWLRPFAKRVPFDPYHDQALRFQRMIQHAGLEGRIDAATIQLMKYASSFGLGGYLALIGIGKSISGLILLGILVGILGYWLPETWLRTRIQTRQLDIQRELPKLLVSLAVVTEAGLNLPRAMHEVSLRGNGTLARELRITVQAMAIGTPQREALEQLAERVNVQELTLLVSAMIQTLEKGASGLTRLLREQASESWTKRKSSARELAEKASIKLFLPLILLTLPALLIFLITPAVFSLLTFFGV